MCVRCGEALESLRWGERADEALCGACRMAPPEFERAVAFAEYDEHLRELMWLLKYERVKPVAGILGKMLTEVVLELFDSARPDAAAEGAAEGLGAAKKLVVVAVPLFPAKQRVRGFNQSEEIARAALKGV
ncbi:MAG: hypothetical protein M3O02_12755, partial [Acidobacteriota bacterium]|nr:hypothetical protein [Acidobacteriota bacterium]